ncbi:MAG TPA: ACT domain-containing protein [Tepidisphaeraceae bacterium]|nr:ACT domain-containing protein [Tepidisphaeraceae bacterium]
MAQLIITAVGPDRPGIVGELTGHLHSAGANLLDSRMINLRGQFSMLILLEAPQQNLNDLTKQLTELAKRMNLRIETFAQPERSSTRSAPHGLTYRLKTYSLDQPGIVARLTHVLRNHGVNIEELSARQESAAFDGGAIFLTEMKLTVPVGLALGKLRSELESVGAELNCDIDLDPA